MKNLLLSLIIFSLCINNVQAQNCEESTSIEFLNINKCTVGLQGAGGMWFDGVEESLFEWKFNNQTFDNVMISGGVWLSALSTQGNQMHSAFVSYEMGEGDFVHGPILSADERLSFQECQLWNRHFKINQTTIDPFKLDSFPMNIADIPISIKEWPAKGNAYLQSMGYTLQNDYAAFNDINNNGLYDPVNGDYPIIKGDQAVYWVFNDYEMPFHMDNSSEKLGVEIQVLAYAYKDAELENATFYDYKIINRINKSYKDLYFSQYIDPDLNHYSSNRLGFDTLNQFVYAYQSEQFSGYPFAMTGFVCTNNNLPLTSYHIIYPAPCTILDLTVQNLRSFQKFGDYCGNSNFYPPFRYPGNPSDCGTGSSECCDGISPNDRRYIMTFGPLNFYIGEELEYTLMVLIPPVLSGSNCVDKETELTPYYQAAKQKYVEKETSCGFKETITGMKNESNERVEVYPNPSNGTIYINKINNDLCTYTVSDMLGRIISNGTFEEQLKELQIKDKGIYFLQLHWPTKNVSTYKRLIVD